MPHKINHFYEFEEFRLDAENPSLWRDGKLVSIPSKVLETLILLVNKKGEIVSRDELLETVWKDTFVEEGNINYTVSLLGKIFDNKNLIQTVPKRGYRFTADVREVSENGTAAKEIVADILPISAVAPPLAKTRSRPVLLTVGLLGILFLTSFVVWFRSNSKSVAARNIKTVAILPLKNLNQTESDKSLSLGLTDSLISRLGSLNRFTVRPLDAVTKFKPDEKDALKFGEELKVDAVLEGTLQQIENRLRLNVRLLDVRDGAQLWTANFDETENNIFRLQDKLAAQVAQSLTNQLSPQDREILSKKHTENPQAYHAYIRGRTIFEQRSPDSFEKAVHEFQRAVALDPTFALAYAGLADAFSRHGNDLTGVDTAESITKARFYANKALKLDAESAEVYVSLGRIKRLHDWDWTGAENDFTRAISLNPNLAEAHLYYAQMLSFLGRGDEALAEINKAADINPISPIIMSAHFPILESRGEYDEALKLAEEIIKFDKENRNAKRALGTFLFHKSEYKQVIEMGEQILSKDSEPKFAWLSLLAAAYYRTNQNEKALEKLRQLEELSQTDTKALYSLAMNYTEFNRNDEAIWTLQKCFEMREERMVWINVEPRLANLKSDTRFQEIVQRIGLQ